MVLAAVVVMLDGIHEIVRQVEISLVMMKEAENFFMCHF